MFYPFATRAVALVALICITTLPVARAAAAVSLREAVSLAQEADPWLQGSLLREQALAADKTAAGSLPDPVVSLGAANLPVDTFDLGQEPMTQLQVGIAQEIPRGDTLDLSRARLAALEAEQPWQRAERRAQVARQVAGLWLQAYVARESSVLVAETGEWFRYLSSVVNSRYASALGNTGQQDIIRAELELSRLMDRQAVLSGQERAARARLAEWLPAAPGSAPPVVAQALPDLALPEALPEDPARWWDPQGMGEVLRQHPAVRALDQQVAAADVGEALAREAYQPQWGLRASYGYREDDPVGRERADFFSLGVTFDLPLFTGNRQDPQLQSAQARTEAMRTDRSLLLRRLRGDLEARLAQLEQLQAREKLYRERLLPQADDQSAALLNAYTSDVGDFTEVVRARITALDLELEALQIAAERVRLIADLHYFYAGSTASTSEGETP